MKNRNKIEAFLNGIVVLGMMIWGGGVLTAQKIHYTYDDAGNRIKKEIVTIVQVKKEDKEVERFLTSKDLDKEVKLKVNEAADRIRIQITEPSDNILYGVEIYSLAGYRVYEGSFNDTAFEIEISGLSKGVYIIRVSNEDKSKIWKIIKE